LKYIIFLLLLTFTSKAQSECSPYIKPEHYVVNRDIIYSISYVSCIHTQGIMTEVGTKNNRLGNLITGKGHHNDVYMFGSHYINFKNINLSAGLLFRVNNNPSICVGKIGTDYKLYKNIYSTLNLFQVNKDLSYMYFGLKINI
jgi:hypothetical protein